MRFHAIAATTALRPQAERDDIRGCLSAVDVSKDAHERSDLAELQAGMFKSASPLWRIRR